MARILDQVIGHEKNLSALQGAIEEGRMAHAYLFVGPSGVGKKLIALGLAQALVCEKNNRGCGTCPSCVRIEKEQSEALLLIKTTGTQIKIDDTRRILEFISYKISGRGRVIIIDEAHLMNTQSANALLKSLEEPPEKTFFFLIASSVSSVLPTIRSRCQVIRFASLPPEAIRKITQAEDWVIASSQGSLSQVEMLGGEDFKQARAGIVNWLRTVFSADLKASSGAIEDHMGDRKSALFMVQVLQMLVRDSLWMKTSSQGLINVDQQDLLRQMSQVPKENLREAAELALRAEQAVLQNLDRHLLFESLWLNYRTLFS